MIGALLACGVPPWFMAAHTSGEDFGGPDDADGDGVAGADGDRVDGARFRLHRGVPALGPGSWRLAVSSLARPYKYSPAALVAGWLPHGPVSTEPLKETVRRVCSEQWAPHPNYWAMSVDYQTGQRVALGRDDAPPASLSDAVAASCAIPACSGRWRSTGAVTSTAASARRRTSTCWSRGAPGSRDRAEPDVVPARGRTAHAGRAGRVRGTPGRRTASGKRGQAPARRRHRGHPDPADGSRPRRNGDQSHESPPPP